MKSIRNFALFFITLLMVMFISHSAFAAEKKLRVGSASVSNKVEDDTSRTVTLDLKATNFEDVNGMVFTLTYDAEVFEYVGIEDGDVKTKDDVIKKIDTKDYSAKNEDGTYKYTQPEPDTIKNTIYCQANGSNAGRVLIAAAGAEYFTGSAAECIPFRVKFKVKQFMGNGVYPIRIQKTIISPETAANAGYTENVALPVAAGLAPDADPTTAQSYPVELISGSITVSGGYSVSGSVKYGKMVAGGVEVSLFKKTVLSTYAFAGSTATAADGTYSFTGQPDGTYKIRVNSLKPGYQRTAEIVDIPVSGTVNTIGVDEIVLAAYQPLSGQVKLNGENVPGLKVKVVKGDSVIGYFNVDADGNFVTTALAGSPADYSIYAVYGGVVSATSMKYGEPFSYDDLALATLNVSIGCMNGKNYMVHVIQSDGKLEKTVSGVASTDTETITIPYLISDKAYRIAVVGDGIPVTFFDDDSDPKQTVVFSDSELITVNSETPTTVAFTFCSNDSNTISGTVTRGDSGEAIDVYAISTDFSNVYATESALVDGKYTYTLDVAPGEYMVYGFYNDAVFYYMTSDASTQRYDEKVIVDASNGDVGAINIVLGTDDTNAYFYGTVTEKRADGNPVPFALIIAESSDRIIVSETNEQGIYKLDGFEADEEANIFLPAFPGNDEKSKAANDGTQVDFVVNQGVTITGVVQVKDSDPITTVSGATVYLKDADQKISGLPVKSDSEGNFKLVDVTAGIYTINAVYPKYKKYTDDIDVQADESIVIEMEAGAFIDGTITDGTNNLDDVSVVVLAPQKSYMTQTANGGAYKIEGLEHGQVYDVFAQKAGYVPQHASAVTADNAGTTQPFTMPAVVTTYTVSGTITQDGNNVADGTQVILYSVKVNAFLKTTTSSGSYSFADVLGSDDYVLIVKRTGKPAVKESIGTVSANVVKNVAIVSTTISGTIDLSDDKAGQTVTVYLVSGFEDVLQTVTATDTGEGNYTYEFTVRSGVNYKIAAFCEGYAVKWYDAKDGFLTADDVAAGNNAANISLTAN